MQEKWPAVPRLFVGAGAGSPCSVTCCQVQDKPHGAPPFVCSRELCLGKARALTAVLEFEHHRGSAGLSSEAGKMIQEGQTGWQALSTLAYWLLTKTLSWLSLPWPLHASAI